MEYPSPESHPFSSQDPILLFPWLHCTEANTWIMGMIQTIPTPAQSLFGSCAVSDTGSSTAEKHSQVPLFKPHGTYIYSLQAELMWFCNTASRAPLTAAAIETAVLLTTISFEGMPRILPAW